jgi:hypothetical protein
MSRLDHENISVAHVCYTVAPAAITWIDLASAPKILRITDNPGENLTSVGEKGNDLNRRR